MQLYGAYVQTVTNNESLVEILAMILNLGIPTPKQLGQCLFSTSGITGLDQMLNSVKGNAIKCFNKVLDIMFNSNSLTNPLNNKFYAYAKSTGMEVVLASVLNFCENPGINLEEVLRVHLISFKIC